MATLTPNLGLVLPDYSDKADVGVINDNFRKIDNFSGGNQVDEWLDDIQEKADESLAQISQDADAYLKSIQSKASESLNEIENKAQNTLDSIPDDYETIHKDVSQLKDTFAAFAEIAESKNLLDPANVTDGYFYGYKQVNSTYAPDLKEDAAFACAYIDVENGKHYIVSGISFNAYNVNAAGQIVGYAANSSANTPEAVMNTAGRAGGWGASGDTVRVYFSWRKNAYPVESYMVAEGEMMPPYEPYGQIMKSLQPDVEVSYNQVTGAPELMETYVVSKDGTGDFTSLMGAFVALKDNPNPKTILIRSGVYDVYEEIGGDAFVNSIPADATSYWHYVTVVPPNTHVIGVGGVVLEYLPESIPEKALEFISPINISDGDVWLENIKIVCTNCRYAIHDQTREDHPDGYTHVCRNVVCIKDSVDGPTGNAQALGGGLTMGANIEFHYCRFDSYRMPFSYHNAHGGSGKILLDNCIINSLGDEAWQPSVRFGNVSGVQVHIPVIISNSYIKNGVKAVNETSVERPNAFDITLLNCTGNTDAQVTTETNIYPVSIFPAI